MARAVLHLLGVVADDLTSAADGAAPFAARGAATRVGRGRAPGGAAAVAALDAGTRRLAEPAAAARAAAATGALAGLSRILFKTVDSTLRGHVRAELAAAFAASGRARLVFAPAFPAAGRLTRGGVQLVDGAPVDRSPYARDPLHPARAARLADLAPPLGRALTLADAACQQDLDRLVAEAAEPEAALWVGSPGLAAALAARFAPGAPAPLAGLGAPAPVLAVVGSANPVSRAQAARAAAAPGVETLCAPSELLPGQAPAVRAALAAQAARALVGRPRAAVIATGGDTIDAVLDAIGVDVFDLLGEIEPGFPVGRARAAWGGEILVGLKAGGFGDAEALARAAARVMATDQERTT